MKNYIFIYQLIDSQSKYLHFQISNLKNSCLLQLTNILFKKIILNMLFVDFKMNW